MNDMDIKKPDSNKQMESSVHILRRSLHTIISEDEFVEPLKEECKEFFRLASIIRHDTRNFSARFYFNIVNEAEKLEAFLDEAGARENRKWVYFSELIASIKNFAIAAFELSHVLNRYIDYFPEGDERSSEDFIVHAMEVTGFINGVEKKLIEESIAELNKQGCDLGLVIVSPYSFGEIGQKAKLPRTITPDSCKTSQERIMLIAESYRKLALKVHRDKYGSRPEPDELEKMIPARINETKVKVIENALHNIQSEYDTHIKNSKMEAEEPSLKKLRSSISVPMHLLEMARWIIHFYERHENEAVETDSPNRISEIVDKNLVLKILSSFAFFYAHKYIMDGKQMSEQIMTRFMRKSTIELPVPKPTGFHARPSYYVSMVVEQHGTDVFMLIDDRKFDARSVLDLLEAGGMLADKERGTVIFEGDERTLKDLKILADCNYCENENIPKELNYIRVARNILT